MLCEEVNYFVTWYVQAKILKVSCKYNTSWHDEYIIHC